MDEWRCNSMCKLVKNYKENDALRISFNKLAEKTFGINFENWYQNGFWREKYIPYSIIKNEEVIANVSVNIIDMMLQGNTKHFIQLGTVMTAEEYRHQGLISEIIEEIFKDYDEKTEGMFLFANDSVLEFYPKFGFQEGKEYQYSKQVTNIGAATMLPVPMNSKDAWRKLELIIEKNKFSGQFDMVNNSDLIMFYVSNFMQENVYYDKNIDTYVIAELENDCLFIHGVFSESNIDIDKVIQAFGKSIKQVVLGFVPYDTEGYNCMELQQDDTTLFVRGIEFGKERLMYPTLSHA